MAGLWSVALRAAMRAFEELGIDVAELCRRCEIDPADLEDADARIPLERTARIWPEGARQFGRPGLGLHAGVALPVGRLEALDYAFATAESVEQGLERIASWFRIVTEGMTRLQLQRSEETLRIIYVPVPIDELRDYGIAAIVTRLRWAGVTPQLVEIGGAAAAPSALYQELQRCPCALVRSPSTVVIEAADGARALPASLPGLAPVIERDLARALAKVTRDGDPLGDVRREVHRAVGAEAPAIESVARRLAVSVRTLQRRLTAQKTTFSAVVDEARRTRALEHLARPELSIGEIAFLLGYSEPSAFSRAFRRWTGVYPADHRAGLRAQPTEGA